MVTAPGIDVRTAGQRSPLSEPLFLLGTLFILVVFFVPGGIAGHVARVGEKRAGRRPDDDGPAPVGSSSSCATRSPPA